MIIARPREREIPTRGSIQTKAPIQALSICATRLNLASLSSIHRPSSFTSIAVIFLPVVFLPPPQTNTLQTPPSSPRINMSRTHVEEDQEDEVREIHTVPLSSASSDQFTTMSHEFNAMVLAGSTIPAAGEENDLSPSVVPDEVSARRPIADISLETVKREEVESKIFSWQTAKVAKINSRFKREEVDISGWESEKVEKASAALKKAERELEERRARALERMEIEVAKAKQKAEEKRASAEAKRAAKVVRVLDMANLMRALGKAPARR